MHKRQVFCDNKGMKKILLAAGVAVTLIVVLAVSKGEAMVLAWQSSQAEKTTLTNIQTLLQPHMIVRKPVGEGPFPVLLQFHGCAGARLPHEEQWAKVATDAGYMAVIVDSNRPRGIDRPEALETVCQGKRLIGQERAGDVIAALDKILQRDDVNKDRIVLAGWSHGGWTVMDYLTMDMENSLPSGLDNYSGERPDIDGAILFYPYCGFGTRSRTVEWVEKPATLALIAGEDTVVDHNECLQVFDRLTKQGVNIDTTVYPDTEHAFR